MPASPSQVRTDLTVITAAAIADVRTVVAAGESPAEIRTALFAAAPLIVGDYGDGSAALALDWYEELRDSAGPRSRFTPQPLAAVSDDLFASVGWATSPLYDLEQDIARMTEELLVQAQAESLALLEPIIQKDVASGFWDTITGNAAEDPAAFGWQRFVRAGACKFCLMLAARGAVYKESTADFAAHTNCHCVAAPSFNPDGLEASAIQYVASKKRRTAKERADLRAYLNQHYPDAPG